MEKKSNRKIPTKSEEEIRKMLEDCEKTLVESPSNIEILRNKGVLLSQLSHFDEKYKEEAINFFNSVLEIEDDYQILKDKAELLLDEKTPDQATECFDKLLETQPNDAESLWGKGAAILLKNKPYLALEYFDKSLELKSDDARTWFYKGIALSPKNETWDEAIECFSKALEINSDDSRVWKSRGHIYQKKNLLDNAIADFNFSISLDPKDWKTHMVKGFALTGKHQFDYAIKSFEKSLELKPDNVESLNGIGNVYFINKKYSDALDIYEKILEKDQNHTEALLQKGYCYVKLNRKNEAKDCFELILQIDPNDVRARNSINQLIKKRQNQDFQISEKDEEKAAIIVKDVQKSFKIIHEKNDSFFSSTINSFSQNKEKIQVLSNINFNLNKGEMIGIIGKNGSGKTTLLKILSGILMPDSGEIKINGTVAPLLQLGVGFNGELTAKENIILSGMLLGFSKSEIKSKVNKIIRFGDLEKFADTKIKNFSAGMHARLAFSTAIQIDPDILLVDEVLAVGDISFIKKSYKEFLSFREKGKSIVFVSHSLEHIKNLCDRAIFLESGQIKMIGKAEQVVEYYMQVNEDDQNYNLN